MSERDWELMKDEELDSALESIVPELPPQRYCRGSDAVEKGNG